MFKHTILGLTLFAAVGCSPSEQPEGQVKLPSFNNKTWRFVAMNNGPSFHVACYEGYKLILIDSYLHREGEYHLTSPKTLATIKGGGC